MELAKIFSDNMVLQRNKPIKIFGTGKGKVSVSFLGDIASTVSEEEEWIIELPAHKAGGPYTMNICLDGKDVTLNDVWIGEVWIASGQSNMSFMFWEMYKRGVAVTDFDINPNIHYFKTSLDNKLEYDPANSGWYRCTKENIMSEYSILSYYFAAKLCNKLDGVHVAILNGSRGWTRIESWIPAKYIDGTDLDLDRSIKNLAPASDIPNGMLFEGHIRPFSHFVTNGVIWYQGESNSGVKETQYYSRLLELLITSWRKELKANIPFLIVQLASYGDNMKYGLSTEEKCLLDEDGKACGFAKIREQQFEAVQNTENTFLISANDTGEFYQIHPIGKDIIAERLVIVADNIINGKNNEYSGPVYESMKIEGNKIIISFTHCEGLTADGELDWLAICGDDGIYHSARYEIVNNELLVYSDKVRIPKNVKYAFSNWAKGGLYNAAGLPALPFRTSYK